MNSIKEKIPYIMLACIVFYLFQQAIPIFKPLAAIAAIMVAFVSFVFFLKTFSRVNRSPLTIPLCMLLLSFFVSFLMASNMDLAVEYLKNFIFVNFVFFSFFILSKEGFVTNNFVRIAFIILLLFDTYDYFYSFNSMALERYTDTELGGVTNNAGYNMICLIPFVYFFRKRLTQICFIAIILLLTLYSAKRGAILIGGFGLLLFLRDFIVNSKDKKNYFLVVVIFALLFVFLKDFFLSNESVTNRFVELWAGNTSGRETILSKSLNGFMYEDSFFRYLFGYGLAATYVFAGNAAHNDWVEMLVNNGICGLVLLCIYYYSLLKIFFKAKDSTTKHICLSCFILLFLRTLFSMSFLDYSSIPIIMLLGYIAGTNFSVKKQF